MTTTNVIAILLFIIPGILAEKISHKMDFPSGKKRTDFGEIINGLVLSFPILFFVLLFASIILGFPTFKEYADNLNNVWFLLFFTTITLIVTLVFGAISNPMKRWAMEKLNKHREKHNKMKIDSNSCWRRFLLDRNECRFIEVIRDGEHCKGFLGPCALPDETKELILYTPDELLEMEEYKPDELFTTIKNTYIDLEKNIVVYDYDMSKYFKWCKSIEEKYNSNS